MSASIVLASECPPDDPGFCAPSVLEFFPKPLATFDLFGVHFAITVTLTKGKLMAQATGQPAFRLWPETETDFFLKEVDAQITFVRDPKGAVTQLILHQSGADQPAKKEDKPAPKAEKAAKKK